MTLFLLVLLAALAFEYINGFHDTANAIATVVSTKVLTPRAAIIWAAFWNLIGALAGTAVAKTISGGLVEASAVDMLTVFCALSGAIIWNIFTWWLGLPSSSSHALIGGLCGAALATAKGNWGVLIWSAKDAKGASVGLWPKVVLPMFTSPLLGLIGGALLMWLLMILLRKVTPRIVNMIFGKAQLVSAGFMGFGHGSNDAQKTMGIIVGLLYSVRDQFEGDFQLKFHLAPPLLSKTNERGELIKQTYGPWMLSVFGWLARFKGLRGQPL